MVARISTAEARKLGLIKGGEAEGERIRKRTRRAMAKDAPQARLFRIARTVTPDAVREFKPIPGRRLRADVAVPGARLVIECDGWEHHGKYKGDFTRDRQRDRDLLLAGWRVLRFTAGEIRLTPCRVASVIAQALGVPCPPLCGPHAACGASKVSLAPISRGDVAFARSSS